MGVSDAFSVIFLGVVNTDLPVVARIGVLMKPTNTFFNLFILYQNQTLSTAKQAHLALEPV